MSGWRDLLGDRMLIVAGRHDAADFDAWLGGPPTAHTSDLRRYVLTSDPLAAGIVSTFREHGQLVVVNITPEDCRESRVLRREWMTVAERLCFRHGLETVLCLADDLVDHALEVAEKLHLRIVLGPGRLPVRP